jgi:uncharacterized integral membrane protein
MKFFLFIVVLIAVAFGIVAFQNDSELSVKFIKWDFAGHIAIVLGVPFLIGLLAGISLLLPSLWKKASQARHLKKQLHEIEEEKSAASEPAEQIEHEGEIEQPTEEAAPEVKEPEKENL